MFKRVLPRCGVILIPQSREKNLSKPSWRRYFRQR